MPRKKRGPGRPKKDPKEGEAIAPDRECGGCDREGDRLYRGVSWCGRAECGLFIEAYGVFLGKPQHTSNK